MKAWCAVYVDAPVFLNPQILTFLRCYPLALIYIYLRDQEQRAHTIRLTIPCSSVNYLILYKVFR
jgi:hypothetical protein